MSRLRRIVMLRHGETEGESSIRFHGRGDVPLSDEGRHQAREARLAMRREVFDAVVASPLQRAWASAAILAEGVPVRLEADFREVDFGRWEGLSAQEIEARDPALYADWQARAPSFEYPGGEIRAAFKTRVLAGLSRLQETGIANLLLVAHKGVIRVIAEQLLGEPLADGAPELGRAVALSRGLDGRWFVGRRGSNPEALGDAA